MILKQVNRVKFRFLLWGNQFGQRFITWVDALSLVTALFTLLLLTYQLGFDLAQLVEQKLLIVNKLLLSVLVASNALRLLAQFAGNLKILVKQRSLALILVTYLFLLLATPHSVPFSEIFFHKYTLVVLLMFLATYEFSKRGIQLLTKKMSPTFLFVFSFLLLILAGAGLLLLPRSTYHPITVLDALFTATSAVCVTGLTTVETATTFTSFGLFILMMLIQVGGIGVMTFTSFFALFFSGQSSIQNQLIIKDLISADGLGDILKTVAQIVAVTLIIEGIGAWVIYHSLSEYPQFTTRQAAFHSVFHSISAFCNAGFSTFEGNLTVPWMASSHSTLLAVCFLIILGGIGFPLQSNLIAWVNHHLRKTINQLRKKPDYSRFKSRMVSLNSRLVLYTTIILLAGGFLVLWLTESAHSLKGLSLLDQLVHAFFWSVTPRTAGFNALGMETLSSFSILIIILLMWIGASPMSTGGGIKTTTFALAWLNILAMIKNEDRIEVHRRQIHWVSVHKAFAIVAISLIAIALSTALMQIFDPQAPLKALLFEATSAISTVGLSLNLTAQLSPHSKGVLILLMFVGRIGVLSFMMTFFNRQIFKGYTYPREMVMT